LAAAAAGGGGSGEGDGASPVGRRTSLSSPSTLPASRRGSWVPGEVPVHAPRRLVIRNSPKNSPKYSRPTSFNVSAKNMAFT